MMPNPNPVGPYQSIREALRAHLDRGLTLAGASAAVNALMGRPADDLRAYKYASALQGRAAQARPVALSLRVSGRVFAGLSARAADRGESPANLALRLIETAVADDMIDAILDDGGDA